MIVRILGEGQYTVPDERRDALGKLDDAVAEAVDHGDQSRFADALAALIAEVRASGVALADDAFAPSDLVVPFTDSSLEETKALLADHGESHEGDDR
jgi:hypothetical protein